jgi:mono/diheme cytochrome c family protein
MAATLSVLAAGAAAQQAQAPKAPTGNAMTLGVMQDRSARTAGETLYVQKCAMCHRQMGMGTAILARRVNPAQAMLEDRRDLTHDYIVAAARGGIGNMPRISRAEVSDPQLETIAAYLMRSQK